jgi:hypothetical protein
MKPKKNPKVDLEKKRGFFLQIGLALSLLFVLGAFEYKTHEMLLPSFGDLVLEPEFEEDIENTFREKNHLHLLRHQRQSFILFLTTKKLRRQKLKEPKLMKKLQ